MHSSMFKYANWLSLWKIKYQFKNHSIFFKNNLTNIKSHTLLGTGFDADQTTVYDLCNIH